MGVALFHRDRKLPDSQSRADQNRGVSPEGVKPDSSQLQAQELASLGVEPSAASDFPHIDQIQAAFGEHDVTSAESQVDSSVLQESGLKGMAADGLAVFSGRPDLHTAAHEAAHIVQCRLGAGPGGGRGPALEKHADAVADAVVAGRSAQNLLESTPLGGERGVQFKGDDKSGLPDDVKKAQKSPDRQRSVIEKLMMGIPVPAPKADPRGVVINETDSKLVGGATYRMLRARHAVFATNGILDAAKAIKDHVMQSRGEYISLRKPAGPWLIKQLPSDVSALTSVKGWQDIVKDWLATSPPLSIFRRQIDLFLMKGGHDNKKEFVLSKWKGQNPELIDKVNRSTLAKWILVKHYYNIVVKRWDYIKRTWNVILKPVDEKKMTKAAVSTCAWHLALVAAGLEPGSGVADQKPWLTKHSFKPTVGNAVGKQMFQILQGSITPNSGGGLAL